MQSLDRLILNELDAMGAFDEGHEDRFNAFPDNTFYKNKDSFLSPDDIKYADNRNYALMQELGWEKHIDSIADYLNIEGYLSPSYTNQDFIQAIAQWQKKQGLGANGIIDERTWCLLSQRLIQQKFIDPNERFRCNGLKLSYSKSTSQTQSGKSSNKMSSQGLVTLTKADSLLVNRIEPADSCKVLRLGEKTCKGICDGLENNKRKSLCVRSPLDITHVVIHSLAGNYENAIQNWKECKLPYKPHYVISKSGEITQVVAEKHIPQHANATNCYSVGIEHDGFAKDPGYFTESMYCASAALTRDICLRNNIPFDRARIIGHDESPGTRHGDPGGYWDWDYYMALVKWDGRPENKPLRIVLDSSSYDVWSTTEYWHVVNRSTVKHAPWLEHSYGQKYYMAKGDGKADNNDGVIFMTDISVAGLYKFSAWWPVLKGNSSNVGITVTVTSMDKRQQVFSTFVRQNTKESRVRHTIALQNTPTWYSLTSLPLKAGDFVSVKILRRSNSVGWVLADAIKLLKS